MARHAKAQVIGRIGRRPEINHTKAGKVLNLSVAVDRGRDAAPDWYRVSVWSDAADALAKLALDKGDLIFAEGRMQLATWEARDGAERTRVEITTGAASVQLLARSRNNADDRPPPDNHATRRTRTDPRRAPDGPRRYEYEPTPPPEQYDDEPPF